MSVALYPPGPPPSLPPSGPPPAFGSNFQDRPFLPRGPNFHRGRGFGRSHGHGHHYTSGGAGIPGNPMPFKPFPSKLAMEYLEFDGRRLRKGSMRKTIDYNATLLNVLEARLWQRDYRDRRAIQPDVLYFPQMYAPSHFLDMPTNAVSTRFVRTATNKHHSPIFCMAWTPEGRRLITGTSTGEFTLWNGLTFNFETILQAHDSPVRSMVWSHNDGWMVTGDNSGFLKYWQTNMNNVKMFKAHLEPIRGISFSPSDQKLTTCSDDGTVRVWDFARCHEEHILRGHGADVKCVHWHPQKSLIASGSKDNQQPIKLWDPKAGKSITTLHAHKSTVMDLKWNPNGNWLATASRDHLLKLFDIRNLREEMQVFRGHKKEASSVAWHPVHEGLFASGGSDGALMFWHVGAEKELGSIDPGHDSIVWTLAWHPLGHILCSGSNDHTTRFWTRSRPGDVGRSHGDRFSNILGSSGIVLSGSGLTTQRVDLLRNGGGGMDGDRETLGGGIGGLPFGPVIPGMGIEDELMPPAEVKSEQDDESFDFGSSAASAAAAAAADGTGAEGGEGGGGSGAIPGFDLDSAAAAEEDSKKKKLPFAKPIPKQFQQQWNEVRTVLPAPPPLSPKSRDARRDRDLRDGYDSEDSNDDGSRRRLGSGKDDLDLRLGLPPPPGDLDYDNDRRPSRRRRRHRSRSRSGSDGEGRDARRDRGPGGNADLDSRRHQAARQKSPPAPPAQPQADRAPPPPSQPQPQHESPAPPMQRPRYDDGESQWWTDDFDEDMAAGGGGGGGDGGDFGPNFGGPRGGAGGGTGRGSWQPFGHQNPHHHPGMRGHGHDGRGGGGGFRHDGGRRPPRGFGPPRGNGGGRNGPPGGGGPGRGRPFRRY